MFVYKYLTDLYIYEAKVARGYNPCKFLDMIYIMVFI